MQATKACISGRKYGSGYEHYRQSYSWMWVDKVADLTMKKTSYLTSLAGYIMTFCL